MGVLTRIKDGKVINVDVGDTPEEIFNAILDCLVKIAGRREAGKKDELQFIIDSLPQELSNIATVIYDIRRDLRRVISLLNELYCYDNEDDDIEEDGDAEECR